MTTHMATATQSALTMVRKATARMVINLAIAKAVKPTRAVKSAPMCFVDATRTPARKEEKVKRRGLLCAALVFLTSEKPFLLEKLYIVYVSGD